MSEKKLSESEAVQAHNDAMAIASRHYHCTNQFSDILIDVIKARHHLNENTEESGETTQKD